MARFADQQTADAIIALIIRKIPILGVARMVAQNGAVMLSTGPNKTYLGEIKWDVGDVPADNNVRAEWQSAAFMARRINNAFLGKYVFGKNERVYQQFNRLYPKKRSIANAHIKKVEAFVSRFFVYGSGGHYYTAACGAKKDRILYSEETPTLVGDMSSFVGAWIEALVTAADIKAVNDIPIQKIKDVYYPGKNIDKAYQLICLGELRMLLRMARWARKAGAKPLAKRLVKEYLERKELYLLERKDTWNQTQATTWHRSSTRSGCWIEAEKHERPVYNLTAQERYDNRQKIIAEWSLASITALPYTDRTPLPATMMAHAHRPARTSAAAVSTSAAIVH